MTGLGILLGHLVGDYIAQGDWMAQNKTNPRPGPPPGTWHESGIEGGGSRAWYVPGSDGEEAAHAELCRKSAEGDAACTAHCLAYTLCVWAFTWWWMPWWGLVACCALHWPIDRFRLARWWMENVSGQAAFASGMFAPWSVVVVDNIFHLLTLYLIALAAGAPAG